MKSNTYTLYDKFTGIVKSGYEMQNEKGDIVSNLDFPTLYINNNDWQGICIGKQYSDGVIIRCGGQEYTTLYTFITNRRWWYDDIDYSILDQDKKEIIKGGWPAQPSSKNSFFYYKDDKYDTKKDSFFGFSFTIYKNGKKVGSVTDTSKFLSAKRSYQITLPDHIDIVSASAIFFILREKVYRI